MKTDDHDELWHLLGKAKKTEVSPFFARNVLRACRAEKQQSRNFFSRFLLKWRPATLACALVLLLGAGIAPVYYHRQAATDHSALSQQTTPVDYEAIKHLDELLAYEENSIWLDNSSSD